LAERVASVNGTWHVAERYSAGRAPSSGKMKKHPPPGACARASALAAVWAGRPGQSQPPRRAVHTADSEVMRSANLRRLGRWIGALRRVADEPAVAGGRARAVGCSVRTLRGSWHLVESTTSRGSRGPSACGRVECADLDLDPLCRDGVWAPAAAAEPRTGFQRPDLGLARSRPVDQARRSRGRCGGGVRSERVRACDADAQPAVPRRLDGGPDRAVPAPAQRPLRLGGPAMPVSGRPR
jgi:hypothetical protein